VKGGPGATIRALVESPIVRRARDTAVAGVRIDTDGLNTLHKREMSCTRWVSRYGSHPESVKRAEWLRM
jgi:hypothetical protein